MRTAYRNPAIRKAFDALETLSADEGTRRMARMREDALRNERSELSAAERKGFEKGEIKGETRGKKIGEVRGELIGKIHAYQLFLKRPLTPKKNFLGQTIKDLKVILKILEADLKV